MGKDKNNKPKIDVDKIRDKKQKTINGNKIVRK